MKTLKNNSKRWFASVGAIGLLLLSLSSCLKDHNTNYNPPTALMTFIQASPDEPPIDFYLDNNMVNYAPVGYGDYIDYFRAITGTRIAGFHNHFSQAKILSDTIKLTANTDYSLFLINKASTPQALLLTDTLKKPASGYAGIRFVNLSPDAPGVDLAIKGGSVLVSNKSFKGYSSFLPLASGSSYTFQVLRSGTSTVLATSPVIKPDGGFVYTMYLQGLVTPTSSGDTLKVKTMVNASF